MATLQRREGARGVRWRVMVRRDGQTVSKTFMSKTAAKSWADDVEHAVKHGKHEDRRGLKGVLFKDLIERYRAHCAKRRRVLSATAVSNLERMERELGMTPLPLFTVEEIMKWAETRLETTTGATVLRQLYLMSSVLKAGTSAIPPIPVDITLPAQARKRLADADVDFSTGERDRVASDDELRRIVGHFRQRGDNVMADLTEAAVGSAMRLGELVRIEWRDLDVERRTVIVRQRKHPNPAKKAKNHVEVPLPSAKVTGFDGLLAIQRQPKTAARIFNTVTRTAASARWRHAMKIMEIDGLRFHDLRHTSATRAARAGLTVPQLQLLTGHRDLKALAKYINLSPTDVAHM